MKTKLFTIIVCILALLLSTASPALATSDTDATSVVVDAVLARPVSFALTLIGAVVFVVSLPVAAPSGSVGKAAQTLVVTPAKDIFTRPLGDFEGFLDY